MKMNALPSKGALTAQLFKADGTVQTIQKNNMIVNVGFDFVANAIGLSTNRPGVMNINCRGHWYDCYVAAAQDGS